MIIGIGGERAATFSPGKFPQKPEAPPEKSKWAKNWGKVALDQELQNVTVSGNLAKCGPPSGHARKKTGSSMINLAFWLF